MRLNHPRATAQRAKARRLLAFGFRRKAIAADMGLTIAQLNRLLYGPRLPKGMRGLPARVVRANFPELVK